MNHVAKLKIKSNHFFNMQGFEGYSAVKKRLNAMDGSNNSVFFMSKYRFIHSFPFDFILVSIVYRSNTGRGRAS